MGEGTAIEWADHTFNPWWGCVRKSPACQHCYAETLAHRFGLDVWGKNADRRYFGDKHWNEPLRWDRLAAAAGQPALVFCASMADVFEEYHDLGQHRARLWDLIEATPNLRWLLLTKRPENMARMVPAAWADGWPVNAWAGTTVEDQLRANERIPLLADLPAAVRFLSCEPLLESVVLDLGSVDWVIVGGESGAHARAMEPEWAAAIRDQCTTGVPCDHDGGPAGWSYPTDYGTGVEWDACSRCRGTGTRPVLFHFKQWGAWWPTDAGFAIERVGKKTAGRLLAGRTWDERPT